MKLLNQHAFEPIKNQLDIRQGRQKPVKSDQEGRYESCAVDKQRDSNSSNKHFCID